MLNDGHCAHRCTLAQANSQFRILPRSIGQRNRQLCPDEVLPALIIAPISSNGLQNGTSTWVFQALRTRDITCVRYTYPLMFRAKCQRRVRLLSASPPNHRCCEQPAESVNRYLRQVASIHQCLCGSFFKPAQNLRYWLIRAGNARNSLRPRDDADLIRIVARVMRLP